MTTMTEAFQPMSQRMEPDIQATLSDFLTYTEHFPSQLIRALTLIQSESRRAEEKVAAIHNDTTLYSKSTTQDDQVEVRKRISHALDDAERAGRMRLEEAVRLRDTAVRESARLDILTKKLKAIPLPSRDPTPEETVTLTSPGLGRTVSLGDALQARRPDKAVSKLRARKIMVPGEVLPPPDPNAPPESLSDWTSPRNSPDYEEEQAMRKITPRPRSRTPRMPRADGEEKRPKPRGPRQPGQPGTNAHSAVAGISTSNALLALNKPPDDAIAGSKWLPWMKLTEWEMAKLRKRMKKNAIWVPSATMVRRELKNLGRGVTGREAARAAVETHGTVFVDESHEPDPTKLLPKPGDEPQVVDKTPVAYAEEDEDADAELINRGMRLNEAKKLKRARMLEEQREAAAQIAREQGQEEIPPVEPTRKRKRESTPVADTAAPVARSPEQSKTAPASRRIRITHIASQAPQQERITSQAQPVQSTTKPESAENTSQRKPTIVLKASKAGSEPPSRRASLRRSSIASLPDDTAKARPARRSKRPAPGVVTGGDEESARVSASRRKAAPRKKEQKNAAPDTITEDEVDPNEPRYCVCGDVSFGMMIACDNEASCEKEWFHLSCVGLEGLPPRRTKWYCPDCRKKLKTGQSTNGLVGRVSATGAR